MSAPQVAAAFSAFPLSRPTSLLGTPCLVEEWGLPEPLVPLSGDGHYWIALDYRDRGRTGGPAVTWFDAEFETELALADDSRSFAEGLTDPRSFPDSDSRQTF
ncbi:hypothetical protein AB0N89_33930 [Amycolatopsis sp. NPDC089917]|uniref:hypothetical protein n=1 Tax=Amycolatopsis sp. NPDC089917 TaxID=3155187 RepID=UPI00341D10FC